MLQTCLFDSILTASLSQMLIMCKEVPAGLAHLWEPVRMYMCSVSSVCTAHVCAPLCVHVGMHAHIHTGTCVCSTREPRELIGVFKGTGRGRPHFSNRGTRAVMFMGWGDVEAGENLAQIYIPPFPSIISECCRVNNRNRRRQEGLSAKNVQVIHQPEQPSQPSW